ncbi:MAG: nucleotidyltransferase/DNA polymerase [bacterium]|nr:MAG: nucleotidyltransferase/DNA polymerase [bacterium]
MATAVNKPNGVTCLLPGDFERIFWARPTAELWGVGTETSRALEQVGITTIGQLAAADGESLVPMFGVAGRVLVRMAHGDGGGEVVPYQVGGIIRSMSGISRSVGHEVTFPRDRSDSRHLERHLLLLSDKVSRRLRRDGWAGHRIVIRIRFHEGQAISRQQSLATPTDDDRIIHRVSCRLLAANQGGRSIRLLGVSVGHLVRPGTIHPLFEEDQRTRRLGEVRDRLRDRFGESSIMPGGVVALLGRGDGEES